RRRSGLQNLLILGCDCISIMISLGIAIYIRDGAFLSSYSGRMKYAMNLLPMLIFFIGYNLITTGINNNFYIRGYLVEILNVIKANIIIVAGTAFVLFFIRRYELFSRLSFIYFFILDCFFMWLLHITLKRLIPKMYIHLLKEKNLIVCGTESFITEYVRDHENEKNFSDIITGIVLYHNPQKKGSISIDGREYMILSTMDGLAEYCREASLDEIVTGFEGRSEEMLHILDDISSTGITIHYQLDAPEFKGCKHTMLRTTQHLYFLTYANQVASVGQLIIKRCMDFAGGLVGCIFLFIFLLIFGPLIKLESKGPIFFTQDRVGRNGRVFKIIKFRSMYADAEERKKQLMDQNKMKGLVFKMDNDPRITRIGKFLRATSIDEFPQFINVIRGDMSLVGTRPPTLNEFKEYSLDHKKRLSFRPGITGLWQVSGRNDIENFEDIVALDIEYIDNWSIALDIKILFKTIPAMFKGK
nr:sugar transferase [Lachnospiraceae bacterium]